MTIKLTPTQKRKIEAKKKAHRILYRNCSFGLRVDDGVVVLRAYYTKKVRGVWMGQNEKWTIGKRGKITEVVV